MSGARIVSVSTSPSISSRGWAVCGSARPAETEPWVLFADSSPFAGAAKLLLVPEVSGAKVCPVEGTSATAIAKAETGRDVWEKAATPYKTSRPGQGLSVILYVMPRCHSERSVPPTHLSRLSRRNPIFVVARHDSSLHEWLLCSLALNRPVDSR